jgi:hypothetical protein
VFDYNVEPWVAVIVIVLTIWRAFHGPYNEDGWRSLKTRWGRRYERSANR